MVWTDRSGRLEGAPVQRADVIIWAAFAALAFAVLAAATDELDRERSLIASGDLRAHGDQVPDTGDDQDGERGPCDLVEPARGGPGDLGAEAAQHRDQRGQRKLPAHPDGRG
jgi:hypothetical protein